MGSGASQDIQAALSKASDAEIQNELKLLSADDLAKLTAAMKSGCKGKVAIITTSADKLGDHPTGAWFEEITAPYYVLKDAGYDVSVVSIKGGKVPPEPDCFSDWAVSDWDRRMAKEDPSLLENVADIGSINVDKVDAIFLAGGHGPCVDFYQNQNLAALVTEVNAKGKIVSAVCHGGLGFVDAKDGTDPLVKGKKCNGFCEQEEKDVAKFAVEFCPESEFKRLGGMYSKGEAWQAYAVRDGRLVTGQNPRSSESTAKLVCEALSDLSAAKKMKIVSAEAHFHPFQVGAPRPEDAHKKIDEFCNKFAAGLADPKDDALLNLFAENGSWADPVGGPPPFVGKEKLAERITKLPPMDYARVQEVFYTVSDKIFLCKTEVKFKDKPNSFVILDKFVVDDDFKITSAEAHFHPFQVGAPRPEEAHRVIDVFCSQFAAGLAHPKDDALLNLFTESGSWADPVGGPPPFVGKEKLAERITKLPPMDYARVQEVFYTVSDKIFLCKTEVKFKDKPNSFVILDKFVVE